MKTVTLEEAQKDLPRLVEEARRGEPVSIVVNGEPVARITCDEQADPRPEQLLGDDERRRRWLSFLDVLAEQPAQNFGRFDRTSLFDERWRDR